MRAYFLLGILVFVQHEAYSMARKVDLNHAIEAAIHRYQARAEPNLVRAFNKAQVAYPPEEIALLTFKKERTLELWAKDSSKKWSYIHTYPLTAYSGHLGPKLKERDGQIPEGIYHLTAFNPFSQWHLSLMIDYPNEFDKTHAALEGRRRLGSDIFLHGKNKSAGCIAIGDNAIEQIFLLARRVGLKQVKLVIAPNDMRNSKPATEMVRQPRWLPQLYYQIKSSLSAFRKKSRKTVARVSL